MEKLDSTDTTKFQELTFEELMQHVGLVVMLETYTRKGTGEMQFKSQEFGVLTEHPNAYARGNCLAVERAYYGNRVDFTLTIRKVDMGLVFKGQKKQIRVWRVLDPTLYSELEFSNGAIPKN